MTKDNPHLPWPREDDKAVVAEMLRDLQSKQWNECHTFIEKLVHQYAKNIPQVYWYQFPGQVDKIKWLYRERFTQEEIHDRTTQKIQRGVENTGRVGSDQGTENSQ